ncbi:L-fucose:H+ symporter permease [Saccharicrinis aurantiacus]|uniref:L-fucose:H+ symporter permease n=1 Tax=Saccharicrinis aurantiacus TaxID=1849719 RepID=UPI00094FD492|nr:L-fucose:H+ symporter permease [Saccharicrinis aurantiacus]
MSNVTAKVVEKKYLLPFIIITSLFALWGFANDITNPMVAAFQSVMELSAFKASFVQAAFYGGYATMAIPAALFVQKYSYKRGILVGLGLYATGALLFWPAASNQSFGFFCMSLYILTFGLAFLETTANPYILAMGAKETSTRRLNLAQAFNPMGSMLGMFVASQIVLAKLDSDKVDFASLSETAKETIRVHDLEIIRNPYVALGLVVIAMFILIYLFKMPNFVKNHELHPGASFKRLFANKIYREGVIAQIFYVAAQIMCWTFIIQYAGRLGVPKATAQMYNIVAMAIFLCSRFISTFIMKYVNSRLLLMIFAIGGICTTSGVILIDGMAGLYCLVATSAFMSLMFPTIYGIALENVGEDTTLGAAGLVMAIVGGCLMPPMQGALIDNGAILGISGENFSFILPFICFIIIAIFGYRSYKSTEA